MSRRIRLAFACVDEEMSRMIMSLIRPRLEKVAAVQQQIMLLSIRDLSYEERLTRLRY